MSQVITNAFEQYWQSCLAAEKPVVLDEFILADIPNLDITSPIDPETGMPPESQIVHRQNVDQRGRINNNAVAYTIVMDTTVGDFSFNAMYLRNKQNGVIGMIVYKGRETKLKTDQTTGQTGNSLVKSMLMGYDQAAEATLTHVDAGTWQIDYAASLRGMDEDLRQLASQLYGHHTFIGDGFKVVEKDGAYQVTKGVAIVGGLRVELKAPEVIHPGTKPIGVWVDVHRAGSLLSEHQNHFTIITSVADLTDHVDSNGYQHYVAKLATVLADGTIEDGRGSAGGGSGGAGSIPDTFALWKRSMAEADYDLIGQFGTKNVIEKANQVLLSKDGTQVYAWMGELPKSIDEDSTPGTSNGLVNNLWKEVSSETLNYKMAEAGGSKRIGFEQAGSGSYARTVGSKLQERITPMDKGAVGDAKTNDQAAFDALEASFSGQVVDLMSKTYLVAAIPTGNRYANGYFKVGSSTFKAVFDTAPKFGSGRIVSGEGALASLADDYDIGPDGFVAAMGPGAMGSATRVKKAMAWGPGSMSEGITLRDNIGIGEDTLKFIESESPDYGPFPGTRMLAIMSNSFRFATTANRGVGLGRNTAQAVTTSIKVTATGANAVSSYCPIDWTGEITNPTPVTADGITAYGADTLSLCDGAEDTAIGVSAGQNIKKADGNYFGGAGAGRLLDSDLSNANKVLDLTVRTGTYTVSGTAVTVKATGVSAVVGNRVRLRATTGPLVLSDAVDVVVVTAPTADQFTFTCPVAFSGSGNIEITKVETATTRTPSRWNSLCGARSGELATSMQECAFNGYSTGKVFNGTAATLHGWGSGFFLESGTKISGYGHMSLRFMQDGTPATNLTNVTGLGANSKVSGDNQLQLGDSATTPYAFAPLQIRSDERDKSLQRRIPGELAVKFVRGLEAWFYKMDLRDDYFEEEFVQVGIDEKAMPIFEARLKPIPKDGSKTRKRDHAGYLTQQVKRLMDELGIDFGIYQDHLVNGGCDVQSLAYEQSIPMISTAVGVILDRLDLIEKRLGNIDAGK
ncbi:phage tail protein [Aeromonas sp. 2692-1]|uniref:phage tail-collar fiber domain-containing protein n=1 Tax=Aeromonas sp. 2692-1 TaxID=2560029 RepID=UPI00209C0CE3|nr:phage tail protein [Aeromonas sp. 2692-1]